MRQVATTAVLLGSLLFGTAHAQLNINGGDAKQVGDTIVTHLAGHTLYIPKGYVSSFMGFAGNLQIHALLPCLLPEITENSAEFRAMGKDGNGFGKILIANLTTPDRPWISGQRQIDTAIENSKGFIEYLKQNQPDSVDIHAEIGPIEVPGSKYAIYRDLLLGRNLYVLPGTDPLLVVNCGRPGDPNPLHADMVYCEAREQNLDNIPLHYLYHRSYIEADPNNAAKIDARIQHLLASFLTPTPTPTPTKQACE